MILLFASLCLGLLHVTCFDDEFMYACMVNNFWFILIYVYWLHWNFFSQGVDGKVFFWRKKSLYNQEGINNFAVWTACCVLQAISFLGESVLWLLTIIPIFWEVWPSWMITPQHYYVLFDFCRSMVYQEPVCLFWCPLTAGLCSLDLDTLLDDFGVRIWLISFFFVKRFQGALAQMTLPPP